MSSGFNFGAPSSSGFSFGGSGFSFGKSVASTTTSNIAFGVPSTTTAASFGLFNAPINFGTAPGSSNVFGQNQSQSTGQTFSFTNTAVTTTTTSSNTLFGSGLFNSFSSNVASTQSTAATLNNPTIGGFSFLNTAQTSTSSQFSLPLANTNTTTLSAPMGSFGKFPSATTNSSSTFNFGKTLTTGGGFSFNPPSNTAVTTANVVPPSIVATTTNSTPGLSFSFLNSSTTTAPLSLGIPAQNLNFGNLSATQTAPNVGQPSFSFPSMAPSTNVQSKGVGTTTSSLTFSLPSGSSGFSFAPNVTTTNLSTTTGLTFNLGASLSNKQPVITTQAIPSTTTVSFLPTFNLGAGLSSTQSSQVTTVTSSATSSTLPPSSFNVIPPLAVSQVSTLIQISKPQTIISTALPSMIKTDVPPTLKFAPIISSGVLPTVSQSVPVSSVTLSITSNPPKVESKSTKPDETVTVKTELTYRDLQECMNNWKSELDSMGKTFADQATSLKTWEAMLRSNGEKINQMGLELKASDIDLTKIEQQISFLESQESEIEKTLIPLEKAYLINQNDGDVLDGGDSFNTAYGDSVSNFNERKQIYNMAIKLDTQLSNMEDELRDVVEQINSLDASKKTNNLLNVGGDQLDGTVVNSSLAINQMTQILDAHMELLKWVDKNTTNLKARLDEIALDTNPIY